MAETWVTLITGARKGIGRALAEQRLSLGDQVIGLSRGASDLVHDRYRHFEADVTDEAAVQQILREVKKTHGRLDALINNAGIASMNHSLLTPLSTARKIMETNFLGTFLLCREAAKLMQVRKFGRIVNLATVASRLKLEGEAIYAASKAAVVNLTEILAREFGPLGITVNAVAPTPIKTDLIAGVPEKKLNALVRRQAIPRFGELRDVTHVVDFFLDPSSDFITGQILYLGGV